jgi:hypothetical protein
LGDTSAITDFSSTVTSEITQVQNGLSVEENKTEVSAVAIEEEVEGPIKRQM